MLVAGALGVLLVADPVAARTYNLLALRTFGGVTPLMANGINEAGDVAGVAATGDVALGTLRRVGFLFAGGSVGVLPDLSGTSWVNWAFLDEAGDVAGYTWSSDYSESHAYLYRGGVLTALDPILGTAQSGVYGMSRNGKILVGSAPASTSWSGTYDLADESLTMIDPPDGYSRFDSAAINDAGDVVGMATPSSSGYSRGFLLHAGVMTPLAMLPDSIATWPNAINEAGQVVGFSSLESAQHAILADGAGPLLDLGTLPGTDESQAMDINAHGQVVGFSGYAGDATPLRAFLYEDGAMQDLNALIDPTLGVTLRSATAINDAGQIAGWGVFPGNDLTDSFVFVLTPTVCGDGLRDFGEACDDGAANGTDGCCAADCSLVDGDGVCDAADRCTTVAPGPMTHARLVAGGVDYDRFHLTGTLAVSPSPAIDPAAHGVRIILTATTPLLDATLPGGSLWKTAPNGRAWPYHDPSGSIAGIIRVTLKQAGATVGTLRFDVRGAGGDYGALASGGTIDAMVAVDG